MKIKDLFLLIIINCLVFQSLLQDHIKIFQYLDEIIAIFLGLYYVLKTKGKISIDEFIIVVICITITLVGIMRYNYFSISNEHKCNFNGFSDFF